MGYKNGMILEIMKHQTEQMASFGLIATAVTFVPIVKGLNAQRWFKLNQGVKSRPWIRIMHLTPMHIHQCSSV